MSEERGHGENGVVYDTLLSDTLYPNGRTGTGTRPGVWSRNKPMDLGACVSEERGDEEGGGAYPTLLSYTLYPNGHTRTDTRPGVWLHNKPTDLSACVNEERDHEWGEVVKLNSEKRVSTGDVRVVSEK